MGVLVVGGVVWEGAAGLGVARRTTLAPREAKGLIVSRKTAHFDPQKAALSYGQSGSGAGDSEQP